MSPRNSRFPHSRPQMRGEDLRSRMIGILRRRRDARQRPPTQADLAQELGISVGTVRYHLDWLEEQGRVRRDPHASRSLELVERGDGYSTDAG